MTISFDRRHTDQLVADLDRLNRRGLPHAVRFSLNRVAYDTMVRGQLELGWSMVERNKWTHRSIQYRKADSRVSIGEMRSHAGSTEGYMADQETGFIERNALTPSTGSANQPYAQSHRTRRIVKSNYLTKMRKQPRPHGSLRSRVLYKVHRALRSRNRIIVINRGDGVHQRRPGVYRVVGGHRRSGSGWPAATSLKLLYGIDNGDLRIRATPWLSRSVAYAAPRLRNHYRTELINQINIIMRRRYG